ncbi:hypothetical protein ACHAQH_001926 [Verticillium albo-atrum]
MTGNKNDMLQHSGQTSTPRPAPFVIFPHEPLPVDLISRIDGESNLGFYGPVDAPNIATQAASAIARNSDADENHLREILINFLKLARDDTTSDAAHSCWLCIRMILPTTNWFVPRWHTDGRMFTCSCPPLERPHSKYAFTILGPSTRIMVPNPAVHAVVNTPPEGRDWDLNDPDPELAERMAEFEEAKVELGQVIRFSWDQPDAPVHSEPDSSGSMRVFISVMFGSEEEIKDMCNLRGEEYGVWHQ